jgi:hypothetical protein
MDARTHFTRQVPTARSWRQTACCTTGSCGDPGAVLAAYPHLRRLSGPIFDLNGNCSFACIAEVAFSLTARGNGGHDGENGDLQLLLRDTVNSFYLHSPTFSLYQLIELILKHPWLVSDQLDTARYHQI